MVDVPTMRKVDAWVGVPVCAALTALRRLGDLLRRPRVAGYAPGRIPRMWDCWLE